MRRYFLFVTSHPVLVLFIAGILALALALSILKITRDTSPDAFIPKDHPALARKKQADEEFGLKEPLVIGIFRDGPGGIFTPQTLRLIRELSVAIQQLPQVDEMCSASPRSRGSTSRTMSRDSSC